MLLLLALAVKTVKSIIVLVTLFPRVTGSYPVESYRKRAFFW
jgi:hypothetical protein